MLKYAQHFLAIEQKYIYSYTYPFFIIIIIIKFKPFHIQSLRCLRSQFWPFLSGAQSLSRTLRFLPSLQADKLACHRCWVSSRGLSIPRTAAAQASHSHWFP